MPAADDLLPPAFNWAEYVGRWVHDLGGWTQLAEVMIHRVGDRSAADPQTVERGLRRLARRDHKPGGQYGRWMLRYVGFTSPIEACVKWMGQYHTRFADLPCALRLDLLTLWNRPPVAESRLACWIGLGIAAAHMSRLDLATGERWLQLAEPQAERAGPAAEIESALMRASLETDAGERASAERRFEAIEDRLRTTGLAHAEQLVYGARLQDQRASHYTRPLDPEAADVGHARELYASIVEDPSVPFVSFRKAAGLAYCAWKLGELGEATRLCELAVDHAGDAGLVRMRVIALNMLSRIVPPPRAATVNARARQMATLLEDEELLRRVAYCTPAA